LRSRLHRGGDCAGYVQRDGDCATGYTGAVIAQDMTKRLTGQHATGTAIAQDVYRGMAIARDVYRGTVIVQDVYRGMAIAQDVYRRTVIAQDVYRGMAIAQDVYRGMTIAQHVTQGLTGQHASGTAIAQNATEGWRLRST
jgi:hypothetical protein